MDILDVIYPGLVPQMALDLGVQLISAPYPAVELAMAVIQYGANNHADMCAQLIGEESPLASLADLQGEPRPQYIRTEGIPPNSRALISSASASIQIETGYLFLHGITVPKDLPGAFAIFHSLAEARNPQALDQRGLMYQHAIGTRQSNELATLDFEKAVRLQNPSAYYHLGVMRRNNAAARAEYAGYSERPEAAALSVEVAGNDRFAAWTLFVQAADAGIFEAYQSLTEMIAEPGGLAGLIKGRQFDWETLNVVTKQSSTLGLGRPTHAPTAKPGI